MALIRHPTGMDKRVRLHRFAAVAASALGLSSCVTYAADLERARRHYEVTEFARALAVLRLLGEDEDALGHADRIRYACLRGMTDYRLASLAPAGRPQDRATFRQCAHDWLTRCAAGMTSDPSALSAEERERATRTLRELNDEARQAPAARETCLPADLSPLAVSR